VDYEAALSDRRPPRPGDEETLFSLATQAHFIGGVLKHADLTQLYDAEKSIAEGAITVPGYTASKSAIAGLTRALANEWAPHGVNVNAIAPGYMETDNTRALRRDPVRSQAILERIPAGRWGSAEDVVGAAVFLASSSADYIHGTVLTVDGGWMGR
jgi:NAD(P)-dependent dehydrogenase (short-subunit alcohol dehydrogenase family)